MSEKLVTHMLGYLDHNHWRDAYKNVSVKGYSRDDVRKAYKQWCKDNNVDMADKNRVLMGL